MSVTVILESRFLRELLSYIANFQSTINLEFSKREGIQISSMDSSHIAMICVDLKPAGMIMYQWKGERDSFIIGINVDLWKKRAQIFAKTDQNLRVTFEYQSDKTILEFGVWDPERQFFDVLHDCTISNIDLQTDRLQPRDELPWICISLDSATLRKEVKSCVDLKADTIEFIIEGDQQEEETNGTQKKKKVDLDQARKEMLGLVPPKVAPKKTGFIPKKLLLRSYDQTSSSNAHIELRVSNEIESKASDELLPGWKRGVQIKSNTKEKDEFPSVDIQGLDDLDIKFQEEELSKKRKSRLVATDRKTLNYVGFVTAFREKPKSGTDSFEYSPSCLSNVSAGVAFANRASLELYEQVMRLVYDLDKLGKISIYLAAKLREAR